MQTVLVTGVNGFIGRHVAAALKGRAHVVTPHGPGTRTDLLKPGAAAEVIKRVQPDLLIHLAWDTQHGAFWTSPKNGLWKKASVALFDAFLDAGGRRALGLGSCAEYDWTTGASVFEENAPLAPHTPYGAAKVSTAEVLAQAAERYGASWAWGRIFFSFGEGEPSGRLVPLMLRAVLKEEPLAIGPGASTRDFWGVRNLGAAIAALALSEVQGPVNLGSGEPTSFASLAEMVETLAGVQSIIHPDQRPLGTGEPKHLVAATDRLRNEVGFAPEISLKQGLTSYLDALARD